MGMFDSFIMKVKCPYCHKTAMRDCQTKQFDKCLAEYIQGTKFYSSGLKINEGIIRGLITDCDCKENKMFYCDVLIKKGIISKAINISKTNKRWDK